MGRAGVPVAQQNGGRLLGVVDTFKTRPPPIILDAVMRLEEAVRGAIVSEKLITAYLPFLHLEAVYFRHPPAIGAPRGLDAQPLALLNDNLIKLRIQLSAH